MKKTEKKTENLEKKFKKCKATLKSLSNSQLI